MRYYRSDFRLIADDIEGGFVLDGSVNFVISVGSPTHDERGAGQRGRPQRGGVGYGGALGAAYQVTRGEAGRDGVALGLRA